MKAGTLGVVVGIVTFIITAPMCGCWAFGYAMQRDTNPLDYWGFVILAFMVPVALGGGAYRKRKNQGDSK